MGMVVLPYTTNFELRTVLETEYDIKEIKMLLKISGHIVVQDKYL